MNVSMLTHRVVIISYYQQQDDNRATVIHEGYDVESQSVNVLIHLYSHYGSHGLYYIILTGGSVILPVSTK